MFTIQRLVRERERERKKEREREREREFYTTKINVKRHY
jgi:hypothetical protein